MNASSFAKLLGWAFVIFGIAGFFTGNTLIVFEVNTVHNLIHIATGIVALIAASRPCASLFLQALGSTYACIAVIGLLNHGNVLGLFQVNTPDNFLHIVIAVGCLYFGHKCKKCKGYIVQPQPRHPPSEK